MKNLQPLLTAFSLKICLPKGDYGSINHSFKKVGRARLFCCLNLSLKMIEEKIANLLEEPFKDMGYNLVQVRMFGSDKGKTLQIMAEKADETPLSVGDLEKISKRASAILDVENVIDARYYLEVSSPGIDRPLLKPKDFERYKGSLINVRLMRANDKGRKFKGNIVAAGVDSFTLKPENFPENFEIDYSNIDAAKLVITDEMLKKKKITN